MPEGDNPQGGDNGLQKLLDKHKGDAMALSLELWGELLDYRRKNRDLRGKVPAEGSVILTKDEAAQYEASKAVMQTLSDLKVKPEELKAKFEEAATENAKLKREGMLHKLVGEGYSLTALNDFDALEGKDVESYTVKDEQKDGKAVRVAYVTVAGKERPLDEYAKEKRPALAPVLKSENPVGGGVAYPQQSPGGKPPSANEYDEIRSQMEKDKKATQPKDNASVLAALGGQRSAAAN